MADVQIFLTTASGSSWSVPADWSATNKIEVIGAGGGGSGTWAFANIAPGGGGGGYSKVSNLVGLSGSIAISVGTGGAGGTTGSHNGGVGGATYFNGASLGASSVGANGGGGGNDSAGTAGAGGSTTGAIGDVKTAGGDGGGIGSNAANGAGGGGAAGPGGIGKNGGAGTGASGGSGGGGAGNTGGFQTDGVALGSGTTGANGGISGDNTAGGTGGTSGNIGGTGSHGSGGGGGGRNANGGVGGSGNESTWDATHGPGGGGGGGGSNTVAPGVGGNAGSYGGGGGGAGAYNKDGGSGADGLIVITYTPIPGVVFDAASNSGVQTAQSTYTFNRTIAGSNRFLAVDVAVLSAGATVTSVVDDSGGGNVAMTFIGARSTITSFGRIETWGLTNPATGTKSIQVNLSGSITSVGMAVSYTGVHQTSPYEGFNSNQATNVGAADATVAVTSVADLDVIHAALATDDASVTAGQTSRNNVSGGATLSGADEDTGPITPAGATTMSYTGIGAAQTWAIAGYALRPTFSSNLTPSTVRSNLFMLMGLGT